jgi:hypothetical protein
MITILAALASLITSSPPQTLNLSALGAPTWQSTFQERICDDQLDKTCPASLPHWRPIMGYGGATSVDNREGSTQTLYTDSGFPGVTAAGALGPQPLGLNPFTVTPSYLAITARPTPVSVQSELFGRTFYSGLVESKFLHTVVNGLFVVKANIDPCAPGTWPAIWTTTLSGWPAGGEIDFPEGIGTGVWWFSLINSANHAAGGQHVLFTPPEKCVRGWHDFGALRTDSFVAYYYDEKLIGSFPTSPDMKGVAHQIILNMDVGGSWAIGASGQPANAPITAYLASVRTWELPAQ